MTVKLLTEHRLEILSFKGQARLSIHLSKCYIVGNHMSRLNYFSMEMVVCLVLKLSSQKLLPMIRDD